MDIIFLLILIGLIGVLSLLSRSIMNDFTRFSFQINDDRITFKRNFPFAKRFYIRASQFKEIRLLTERGFATGALLIGIDGSERRIEVKWLKDLYNLEQFAIRNGVVHIWHEDY